jgi:hypothetical protein
MAPNCLRQVLGNLQPWPPTLLCVPPGLALVFLSLSIFFLAPRPLFINFGQLVAAQEVDCSAGAWLWLRSVHRAAQLRIHSFQFTTIQELKSFPGLHIHLYSP